MMGELIFVSGLTGAGKTTLVSKALENIDNLEVQRTYVTRPMRPGEENSAEYIFVSEREYNDIKQQSNNWDETIYYDIRYGSDAEKCKNDLQQGINIIVCVTPNMGVIKTMAKLYKVKPVTIWIDTPRSIAESRASFDKNRSSRVEDDSIKSKFDLVFTPENELKIDSVRFTELIESVIGKNTSIS